MLRMIFGNHEIINIKAGRQITWSNKYFCGLINDNSERNIKRTASVGFCYTFAIASTLPEWMAQHEQRHIEDCTFNEHHLLTITLEDSFQNRIAASTYVDHQGEIQQNLTATNCNNYTYHNIERLLPATETTPT
ncbi:hypothetical protein HELRODRAFT_175039 [Helobdella robusta]|uniref:Uncharacterized protein n=1 Tax=Helobdella robusta TaxID=6412 RepID=T1F8S0_HELRO|nr:hypothetical protein HELRODRAFT_175039 [Helobdella robusta]ESO01015.1 hypothetical protein HELRODRAFT_175039 [Helobdella robusta]